MRVGFDGRDLLRKRTGVVNYAVQLARQLGEQQGGELLVYVDGYSDPAVQPPVLPGVRRLSAPPVLWKHAALPLALAWDRVDLFHSPTGTLPLLAPCRQVVTIHDLFAEIEPAWFPPRMARQLRTTQRRAAHAAAAICAVSARTARDVVERYGVVEQKVYVVPNGVDHGRFHPPSDEEKRRAGTLLAQHGVRQPFVLCVGSLLPWRNAPRLLRAVAAWRQDGGEHELLFVGRDVWGADPTQREARERGWTDWAHFAGYVDDADLPSLYWAADVLACPSLYEGFGIPPLEALACGTPVVASRRGAVPEVLGDAAVYVDPEDEHAMAEALRDVATSSVLRADLRRRGLTQAARYDWRVTAEQTWRVYERVAA